VLYPRHFAPVAKRQSCPYIEGMNTIALRPSFIERRRLILVGLVPAFALALAAVVLQFDASRECRGSFNAGFSSGFDLRRCDLVVRKIGSDLKFRVPIPQ
jgi:hypothetical protein